MLEQIIDSTLIRYLNKRYFIQEQSKNRTHYWDDELENIFWTEPFDNTYKIVSPLNSTKEDIYRAAHNFTIVNCKDWPCSLLIGTPLSKFAFFKTIKKYGIPINTEQLSHHGLYVCTTRSTSYVYRFLLNNSKVDKVMFDFYFGDKQIDYEIICASSKDGNGEMIILEETISKILYHLYNEEQIYTLSS